MQYDRRRAILGGAIVAGLPLAAAAAERPVRRLFQDNARFMTTSTVGSLSIENHLSDAEKATTKAVARIRINTTDLANLTRHVKYYPYDRNTQDNPDDNATSNRPIPETGYAHATPIDMKLGGMIVSPGDLVMIKILLVDPKLRFMDDEPNGDVVAVTAGDASSRSVLSDLIIKSDHQGQARRIAKFWCRYSSPPVEANYNIGLIVGNRNGSGYQLRIIIDPKVKNTG